MSVAIAGQQDSACHLSHDDHGMTAEIQCQLLLRNEAQPIADGAGKRGVISRRPRGKKIETIRTGKDK